MDYIRKFKPNLKHIAGAVLAAIGLILLTSGAVRAVGSADPKSLDSLSEGSLRKGMYVTGELDELLIYGYPNGALVPMPVNVMTAESSADPISSASVFAARVGGKYRAIRVDEGVTPELYSYINEGTFIDHPEKAEFTGVITGKDHKALTDYLNRITGTFCCGDEELSDLSPENCSSLGIRIVDPEKEKNKWLIGLPFLIIGAVLLILGGSPYLNIPDKPAGEQSPEKTHI